MSIPPGGNNRSLLCLRLLLRQPQRKCHALAEEAQISAKTQTQEAADVSEAQIKVAQIDMNKWKKLDSRSLGIKYGVIPHGPWKVMRELKNEGFDSYLVGGCVRDLLLKKTPKDFDVITTANLKQVRKHFFKSEVVGQRFPICMVHIKDSTTEVSSFDTTAKNTDMRKELLLSQPPEGCEIKDFTLWKDSMRRDFTINSLFLDPFTNKIYDYSSGMADLKSLKLRTIISAEVSFEEDCARILRGLRIAARLGLSFSKDTEAALLKLSPTVTKLAKARLLMEVNYMLSYGAAEPSLSLLHRFKLLELLLPLQAVYLDQPPSAKSRQNSRMLMKLLSNLDKVASCDHPSDCRLWVGLLAFHLTLVNNPQDAFVVLNLASILYHGEWKEGLRYARENAEVQAHFKPELLESSSSMSDEELADEVSQLAAFVQDSIDILTEPDILLASMSMYPTVSFSGLIFIPRTVGQHVSELFQMLVKQNPLLEDKREDFGIDYQLLGKGFKSETRFVLGKIILETMGCKTFQSEKKPEDSNTVVDEVRDKNEEINFVVEKRHKLSKLLQRHVLVRKDRKSSLVEKDSVDNQKSENKLSQFARDMTPKKNLKWQDLATKKDQKEDAISRKQLISVVVDMLEKRSESQNENVMENEEIDFRVINVSSGEKKFELSHEEIVEEDKTQPTDEKEIIEKDETQPTDEKEIIKKDETQPTDGRCESSDREVLKEEKGEIVKKRNKKKSNSKGSQLRDKKDTEQNSSESMSELAYREIIAEIIKEEKEDSKKRDSKNKESPNSNAARKEERGKDVKKRKRKDNSEQLNEKVTERKNNDVKKTKSKGRSERLVTETRKESVGETVEKKKKASKKWDIKSKNALVIEKKVVVIRTANKEERKQVVGNRIKDESLLSSLFK